MTNNFTQISNNSNNENKFNNTQSNSSKLYGTNINRESLIENKLQRGIQLRKQKLEDLFYQKTQLKTSVPIENQKKDLEMDLSSLVIPDDITPKFDLHQVSPDDLATYLLKLLSSKNTNIIKYGLLFINELLINNYDFKFLDIMIKKKLTTSLNRLLNLNNNQIVYEALKCYVNIQNCSSHFDVTMSDESIFNIDNCYKYEHVEITVLILQIFYQCCEKNIKISEKFFNTNVFKYICEYLLDEKLVLEKCYYFVNCALNFLIILSQCNLVTVTNLELILKVLANINNLEITNNSNILEECILKGYMILSEKSNLIEITNNIIDSKIITTYINKIKNCNSEYDKKIILFTTRIIANISSSDYIDLVIFTKSGAIPVISFFNFLFDNNLNEFSNKNILISIENSIMSRNETLINEIIESKIITKLMKLAFNYDLEVQKEFNFFIYYIVGNNISNLIEELLNENLIGIIADVFKKLSNQYLIKQYLVSLYQLIEYYEKNSENNKGDGDGDISNNKLLTEFELQGGVDMLEKYVNMDGINDEIYGLASNIYEKYYNK